MTHSYAAASRTDFGREAARRAFRRLAVFALKHSGRGYLEAFQSSVGATRFFEDTPTENAVFVELADSVSEMPTIARLAVRGALADPSPDVVRAGRSILRLYPELGAPNASSPATSSGP